MDIKYYLDTPESLSTEVKNHFLTLLILQNQVDDPSLEKIESCPYLCIAYENENAIGIAAIKQVYKTPFDKSSVPELKELYNYELGYVYVLDKEEYRGKGIAKTMCTLLMDEVKPNKVFSTTNEEEGNVMNYILPKFGFSKVGKTYQGQKTGKQIALHLSDNDR